MNLFRLVWNYLRARAMNTVLNVLLLALGVAVITLLLVLSEQLQQKIARNAKGIDLVVGAKGSPLQIILCSIFHIDFPTGNIKLQEADRLAKHRLVKKAIPLALGDSYRNYRIVGTTQAYTELYELSLSSGNWWKDDLEVTIGSVVASELGLKIGDQFESSHGLTTDGHAHEDRQYKVVGILKGSGTILDNLLFTNIESVWRVHEEHERSEHIDSRYDSVAPSVLVPSVSSRDSTLEITSLILQYRNPIAAIQLPRLINGQTNMQAASPAFETARLFSMLGIGVDVLMGFAYVLIIISALSIFIALYNSLKERQYDLAIMRSMGASRGKLFFSIVLEGSAFTFLGSVSGVLLGHGVLYVFTSTLTESQRSGFDAWVLYPAEGYLVAGSLLLGFFCSLIPAIQAYRVDIHKVLAGS